MRWCLGRVCGIRWVRCSHQSDTPGRSDSRYEALEEAGRGVGDFNEGQTLALMEELQHVKAPDVFPFKQSLEAVNDLHNRPHRLTTDGENIYLLPLS